MRLQKGFGIASAFAVVLGIISVIAILGAYISIQQSRNNPFEKNILTISSLQQLDAKWTTAILNTRSFTLQDFDQLALYMTKIRETLASLDRQGMLDEKVVGKQTVNQYQIYRHSFATKNEAVEQYKSQQAILRNSVRYLPAAGEVAQLALTKKNGANSEIITDQLENSKLLVNQYLLAVVSAENAKKTLEELGLKSSYESGEIQEGLRDYLVHSALIIKHKSKVDEALQTSMSVDIAKLSTNLVDEYVKFHDVEKLGTKYLQQVMVGGGMMLLALLLWFLLGLRKSAAKVLAANTENEAIRQQLLSAKSHIMKVNRNIARVEQQSALGEMGLNTINQLNVALPAFSGHISLLKKLKTNSALTEYKDQINLLIADVDDWYGKINAQNALVAPQENQSRKASIDFNHIVQSALDTVSSEVRESVSFNVQLSRMPDIQLNSTDLYQIATKLLHLSVKTWQEGDKSIIIKTWATGHYANLVLTLSGIRTIKTLDEEESFAGVRKLLRQSSAVSKLVPRKDGESSIMLVSFPFKP